MQVNYENHGDIFVIAINNPPVNALGKEVRAGICDAVKQYNLDKSAKVAIIYGIGELFLRVQIFVNLENQLLNLV